MDRAIREMTAAMQKGDAEAFTRFYGVWFDRMYAEARRASGRDESFCLDAVQEGMVRVIKSVEPMESERALAAWLRLVVRSAVYDLLRRELRRRRREEDHAAPAPTPDPAESAALEERLAWLRAEIAALDERAGAILAMRYHLDHTLQRIGRSLGLGPGAVDGQLRRLTDRMRAQSPEEGR